MDLKSLPTRIGRLLATDPQQPSLLTGLIERDEHMRLTLLAALAGEHALLVGPPGTAKSLLARRLKLAFRADSGSKKSSGKTGEIRFFERLLTQFSVPEELFGPYSLDALEAKPSRYERAIEGYLPDAHVAFLDEIFKSNPAILNALLTLLNERVFHDGNLVKQTELIAVVGASNEVPEPGELDALYDRFLVRCEVGYVEDFQTLLKSGSDFEVVIPDEVKFTRAEVLELQAAARKVSVPDHVDALLELLRHRANELALGVSDRRWLKIRKLLQTAALTSGRSAVSPLDVLLVPHCIWSMRPQPVDPKAKDTAPPPAPAVVRNELTQWLHDRIWSSKPSHPELPARKLEVWEQHLQKLAAKNLGDPQAQAMLDQVIAEREQFAAHQEQLEETLDIAAIGLWFVPSVIKTAQSKRASLVDANRKLLKRAEAVLDATRNMLQATIAGTLAGMVTGARSQPAKLDFMLPGKWFSRPNSAEGWKEIAKPDGQVDVAWEQNQQYRFEFSAPATQAKLTQLVRDFGHAPQFVGLSLGGASGKAPQISNLSLLREAPYLEDLSIDWNIAVDLAVLGALTTLKKLSLNGTPLSSLDGIEPLVNLRDLSLTNTVVADLTPLKPLSALSVLDVRDNQSLMSLSGVQSLVNLETLCAGATQIADLAPVSELQCLSWLSADLTPIKDLQPLRALQSLQTLVVRGASITSLSGIETVKSLVYLYASRTAIVDLTPLTGLGLTTIELDETQVESVEPLRYCSQLQTLSLQKTPLKDLSPLVWIQSLQKVTLKGVAIATPNNIQDLRGGLPNCTIEV